MSCLYKFFLNSDIQIIIFNDLSKVITFRMFLDLCFYLFKFIVSEFYIYIDIMFIPSSNYLTLDSVLFLRIAC